MNGAAQFVGVLLSEQDSEKQSTSIDGCITTREELSHAARVSHPNELNNESQTITYHTSEGIFCRTRHSVIVLLRQRALPVSM